MIKNSDPFPLSTYTDELAERLRSLISPALNEGDVIAIHQARVTTRRLRAALNLLETVIPHKTAKPVAKTLKKLRRQLGPLRDSDVMLAHLEKLKRYPKHHQAIDWLESQLRLRRTEAAKEALAVAAPAKLLSRLGAWWAVSEAISSAQTQADGLLAASLHRQLADFRAAAEPLVQPVVETESSSTLPANPHTIRIAGKLLRYTVEMASVQGHALPASIHKSFKKMQDALGDWHDFVVLVETAMELSVAHILPATNAVLQQKVLDLATLGVARSQVHLKKFADLWLAHGGAISEAIAHAFPLEANAPKKDPDPAGLATPPAPAVVSLTDPSAS